MIYGVYEFFTDKEPKVTVFPNRGNAEKHAGNDVTNTEIRAYRHLTAKQVSILSYVYAVDFENKMVEATKQGEQK